MTNLFYDRTHKRSQRTLEMPSILSQCQEELLFEDYRGWSGSQYWISPQESLPEELKGSAFPSFNSKLHSWDFILDFISRLNALELSSKEKIITTWADCRLQETEHHADGDLNPPRPMMMIQTKAMVQAESLGNVVGAAAAAAVEWLGRYQGHWVMPLKEGEHLLYLSGGQAIGALLIQHSGTLFMDEVGANQT